MYYPNMKRAAFVSRPNRFIAHIMVEGQPAVAHVKNTGRCKELLVSGATLLVQECDSPKRKTKYDVIAVYKGDRLIHMDSQAPNHLFREWLEKGNLFTTITYLKGEAVYGRSRFDFYVEGDGRRCFVEVKGVTLEENGVVRFPDAPTERGVKHIEELCDAMKEGYEAYLVFIIQMHGVICFRPNDTTHPAFGEALRRAEKLGVQLLALDCKVTEDSAEVGERVPVLL